MPRKTIPLITGETYHVFNRGVEKRRIFEDRHDYLRFYLALLLFNTKSAVQSLRLAKVQQKQKSEPIVSIRAYCLLPNHYHLLLTQLVEGGISEFLKRAGGGYTCYFNERYERSGSLFEGTFKRVHIRTEEQFRYVFAYVNENYSVHGLKRPRDVYRTSSLHFSGQHKCKLISTSDNCHYDQGANEHLARDIYKRRNDQLLSLLLE